MLEIKDHSAVKARKVGATVLLMAMVMLGVFPVDVLLPSFPSLSQHFSTTTSEIALSISFFAIGISLSQLLIGLCRTYSAVKRCYWLAWQYPWLAPWVAYGPRTMSIFCYSV